MEDVVSYDLVGDIAVITINNPPVNAIGWDVRSGLWHVMDRFSEDPRAAIAVLVGANRMFVGGADLKEFGKPLRDPTLPALILKIEASAKPVVAAMHGHSLGGGFELSLGCHYRLATEGTRIALPEVTLGLLPGAGGTQRVARLVGITKALDFILSGRPRLANEALQLGLVDRTDSGNAREAGLAFARELVDAGAKPRRISDLPSPAEDVEALRSARESIARTARGQVAPLKIVQALEATSRMSFVDGLALERRLFLELMDTPQRAGLVHAFFVERQVSNLRALAGVSLRAIQSAAVIGGGTMGAGIATALLLSGLHVILIERDAESADSANGRVARYLDEAVKRGKLGEPERQAITHVRFKALTDYSALSDVDLAIEAVFESLELKKTVFRQLDDVMRAGAILATNTSYLNIEEIAAVTRRPADVVGLHFFSPAHVMKLLEVVVTPKTSPDVIASAFGLAKSLGKIAVRSGVCDGFIGNRILAHIRGAADRLVWAGASPYQVDRAIRDFGFPMGPYAVADLAGLDIGFLTRQRKAATRDPRDIIPAWADDLYNQGRLGQKTGRGYYIYAAGDRIGQPDPEMDERIARHREQRGILTRNFSDLEIQRRYMAALVNEAANVIDENIAARPLDVDAVFLFGYGFPRHCGGPMHWADAQGLAGLLDEIRDLHREDPFFWTPAPLLERLVQQNRTFASLNDASEL